MTDGSGSASIETNKRKSNPPGTARKRGKDNTESEIATVMKVYLESERLHARLQEKREARRLQEERKREARQMASESNRMQVFMSGMMMFAAALQWQGFI